MCMNKVGELMADIDSVVYKVEWDSQFFKYNIFRTNETAGLEDILKGMEQGENGIDLVYHFQNPSRVNEIYLLENHQYHLVEQKVDLALNLDALADREAIAGENIQIFTDRDYDITQIQQIAQKISQYSRFANDRRFKPEKIEELYKLWVYNSYYRGFADRIFIYINEHRIYGFCIIKVEGQECIRISLIGVDEKAQRNSIGSQMLQRIFSYYRGQGFKRCLVSTQMKNIQAINFYIKNNFLLQNTCLIYHRWFKEEMGE